MKDDFYHVVFFDRVRAATGMAQKTCFQKLKLMTAIVGCFNKRF
jgi:hypothetical protein